MLISSGSTILALRPGLRPVAVASIDPHRAQAGLIASGCRPEVAREIAYGPLTSEAARRLAKQTGLTV
jgi:hypothetical protein